VQVWDAEMGGLVRTYHDVTTSEISSIDLSPGGRKLTVADTNGGIAVCFSSAAVATRIILFAIVRKARLCHVVCV
jgi:hypothetical protein